MLLFTAMLCYMMYPKPPTEKARSMADLGEAAFPHFVCVEPGTVKAWVTVPPAASLVLTQLLEAL